MPPSTFHMHRAATAGLAAAATLAVAPGAAASNALTASVTAPAAVKRTCEAELLPGAAGVVARQVVAQDRGLIRARLGATSGDWDLALFDATSGRLITASTGFGSREVAEGGVRAGQRVVVQACRRKGRARVAHVTVKTIALPADSGEKIALVRVEARSHAERNLLASSDLDLTEHGDAGHLDVLAHGPRDLARLRRAGFEYEVVLPDVVEADRAALRRGGPERSRRWSPGDGTPAESARGPIMPSGRLGYRHLWDYTSDMKALLESVALRGYVRPVTLPHPSLEGRSIEGIEIAEDVHASDGRPVFLQMGVHHAREWPSGEHAIEFAFDLLNNRKATDVSFGNRTVNVKRLLRDTRTVVVPVVNPDGFNLSREAATDGQQGVVPASFAYKRKNCRVTDGLLPQPGQCGESANRTRGVDPNRNYGAFWGGPGASGTATSDTYWGAGPFSEPETQNVRELVSQRQVVTLITNHTYSDLVLRPPGLKSQGAPFDETSHYKPLGDAMAAQNGYVSQHSYALYDTTGTTEDWSYNATGGLGFTFEIGKGEGVALTGAGFHPAYPVGVLAEYFGKGPWAGKGNRSAYFVALEFAAEESNHSLIEGRAKPGSILRLTKTFQTQTSPRASNNNQPISFTDTIETVMTVGNRNRFEWHVNPSTRPRVAESIPPRVVDGRPQTDAKDFQASLPATVPDRGASGGFPGNYEERQFTIPSTEDNGRSTLRIEYPVGANDRLTDLDLYLFRQTADGWEQIAASESSNTATAPCRLGGRTSNCYFEEAVVPDLGNGTFKMRVQNWSSQTNDWMGRMTFEAPVASPGVPAGSEAYTLTCTDAGGKLRGELEVTVARGERVNVGDVCKKN